MVYIKHPSEKTQLESVKQDGLSLKYIEHPSEKVQIEAVKENNKAIVYIDNPSEALQLEAVRKNNNAFFLIETVLKNFDFEIDSPKSFYKFFYLKNKSNIIKKFYYESMLYENTVNLLTEEERGSKLFKQILVENKL